VCLSVAHMRNNSILFINTTSISPLQKKPRDFSVGANVWLLLCCQCEQSLKHIFEANVKDFELTAR